MAESTASGAMLTLLQLSIPELEALAESVVPDDIGTRALPGSLAPAFVARRALAGLRAGLPAHWCSGFHIVRAADRRIVGGCGFKGIALQGRVEIGYGVAPSCRKQGAATAAVRELLRLAFVQPDADAVLARIGPDNAASTRVVVNLNFERGATRPDDDNELLVDWLARRAVHGGLLVP